MFDEPDDEVSAVETANYLVLMRPETVQLFHACSCDDEMLRLVRATMPRSKLFQWVFMLDLLVDPDTGTTFGRRVQRGCITLAPRQSALICAGCLGCLGRDAKRIDVSHARLPFVVSAACHDRPTCERRSESYINLFVQTLASQRRPPAQQQ